MSESITRPCYLLDERDFPFLYTGRPSHGATRVAVGIGGDTHACVMNRAALQMAAERLLELASVLQLDEELREPEQPYVYP